LGQLPPRCEPVGHHTVWLPSSLLPGLSAVGRIEVLSAHGHRVIVDRGVDFNGLLQITEALR